VDRETKLPAQYSAARKALAVAVKVEQAKHVHDVASGMAVYAYKAKDGALAGDAAEIKIRATRKIGDLIKVEKAAGKLAKPTGGHRPKGQRGFRNPVATLDQRGVDKNLAKRARVLEAMPEGKFEREVVKVRRLAAAAAEGDREIVLAAKAERHAKARARRTERETAVAGKILALPQKRYGVIYADPEWQFETYSEKGKLETAPETHYRTSSLDDIKARDVPSISATDCVLFLWATVPMLPQALEVMQAWGFDYVSHVIWKKDRGGTGYWFRNWHELLLVGTHGHIPAPAQGTQWPSVIEAPRGRHSEKPDRFYELIEEYFPNIPKIELNARCARAGWDAWGFEAPAPDVAA
jgi:N6-adenosine-specific RNA methylase IME4